MTICQTFITEKRPDGCFVKVITGGSLSACSNRDQCVLRIYDEWHRTGTLLMHYLVIKH